MTPILNCFSQKVLFPGKQTRSSGEWSGTWPDCVRQTNLLTSYLAQSHEVLQCVGLCKWPNWISYVAFMEWTSTGNSTLRNFRFSCHSTCNDERHFRKFLNRVEKLLLHLSIIKHRPNNVNQLSEQSYLCYIYVIQCSQTLCYQTVRQCEAAHTVVID